MKCDTPFYVMPKFGIEKVPVPCGRCPPCKMRRVDGWVFRMMQEQKVSTFSHFVTLTYDTDHVPISENGFMTLKKSDLQRFFHKLRKLTTNRIKYYAVGEYGSENHRPHYHAIIFNCPDPELFARAWSIDGVQIGKVDVGTVTDKSVAYTMKYIDKSNFKKRHGRDDRHPEFPLMSKKIGVNYIDEEMLSFHQADISRMYCTKEGGHKIAMPRYYRNKIYSEFQLKRQVEIIQGIADEQERKERIQFDRTYYKSPEYTFEQWKDSRRFGRYNKFYSNQKKRNV